MRPLIRNLSIFLALCAVFALAVPAALTVSSDWVSSRRGEADDFGELDALSSLLVLASPGATAADFEDLTPLALGDIREYYGSQPSAGVYVTQTRRHTCTLIACTMMLRNYAYQRSGEYETYNETTVGRHAWSKAYGLAQHFTMDELEISSTPEIRRVRDKKQYLIEKLKEHPEGIVIYDTGAPHAIYLFGYDADMDVFYCADTINRTGGRPIRLEQSIIRGETQAEKIATIDKIWFVVDKDGGMRI